ncbi:hypothetical protein H0E87_013870 [Populus deltoides]|uniref:Uncharacterized protein n=1 Tax=Populus deltoides TaxID=3696 RepID=A0A8T2YBF0_POPDE|nr:hypothetical protein H0E87_013870 [Populus deltoides]
MGEQNSACGAASNEITSTLQKNPWKSWKDNSGELSGADFSSDVRIEEVGTSKARPAAISDSYYNLNSSEFMELCIISNPASDGEEVQEARDQSTKYNHLEAIADGINSDQRHEIDCPYSKFDAKKEWSCYGEGKRCGR